MALKEIIENTNREIIFDKEENSKKYDGSLAVIKLNNSEYLVGTMVMYSKNNGNSNSLNDLRIGISPLRLLLKYSDHPKNNIKGVVKDNIIDIDKFRNNGHMCYFGEDACEQIKSITPYFSKDTPKKTIKNSQLRLFDASLY